LTPDGNTLYFISDMPGGKGGTDLYYCKREGDAWGPAVNLGAPFNTPENEMFPFVAANGDLYYASAGLPGFGGLDLFVAKADGASFNGPKNMGMRMNSSYDDFGMAMWTDNCIALFSSNRPGGVGEDDIYHAKCIPPKPKPLPILFVSGCVKNKLTGAPIPGATLFMLDKTSGQVVVAKAGNDGCYRIEINRGTDYVIKAMHPGFIADALALGALAKDRQTDPESPRNLLLEQLIINKPYKIDNIYYDFDKYNIREDAKPELNNLVTIMKENPIKVELGSHTDSRGSDQYNQVLSQKRAESAVSYIVSQGISPDRITAKGYGESQLVNKCSNGVPCTPEEHQANRRTEFKVVSQGPAVAPDAFDPSKYSAGETLDVKNLPAGFFDKVK
jgi:outer membrane protein OmpA-like peptidoglycan-associated protein